MVGAWSEKRDRTMSLRAEWSPSGITSIARCAGAKYPTKRTASRRDLRTVTSGFAANVTRTSLCRAYPLIRSMKLKAPGAIDP